MLNVLKTIAVPIHREGYPFVVVFAAITFLLFTLSETAGFLGLIVTVWCYYFFRNPQRVVPQDTNLITSPADGVVQLVQKTAWPKELSKPKGLKSKVWRISIFMNVFNVHVNRSPINGTVTQVVYVPGKFFNASLDKASEYNERQYFSMKNTQTKEIVAFTQIAGLVARRITRGTKEGATLEKGAVFGMIRFGSRVDVYLPDGCVPLVCEGQQTIAGETILSDFQKEKNAPTTGKVV